MGRIGIWELLIILAIAALIFGGRKLPELGKGLGQGLTNFRNAIKGRQDEGEPKDKPSDEEPDKK